MISIRKYLHGDKNDQTAPPGSNSGPLISGGPALDALHRFSSGILDCIHEVILTGDAHEALRARLLRTKETLGPEATVEQALLAIEAVSAILCCHRESSQRADVEQLVEAQHIFAMLNQALVVLVEGNDRDLSRLVRIQESLQRTAAMRDIAQMKESLQQTMRFIEAESAQAIKTAAGELGRLRSEVTSAREFFGNTRLELGGRPEGVARISGSLKKLVSGEALYLVAYLCDRLTAVTQRYGPGVAEELISRLIRERMNPVMGDKAMFRWTPLSLVAIFTRPRDEEKLRKEIAELNRTPLVHKMALNGRTAVLTVSPSHLVAEGTAAEPLIEQVDRFTLACV